MIVHAFFMRLREATSGVTLRKKLVRELLANEILLSPVTVFHHRNKIYHLFPSCFTHLDDLSFLWQMFLGYVIPSLILFSFSPVFFFLWIPFRVTKRLLPKLYFFVDEKLYSIYQRCVLFFYETWAGTKVSVGGSDFLRAPFPKVRSPLFFSSFLHEVISFDHRSYMLDFSGHPFKKSFGLGSGLLKRLTPSFRAEISRNASWVFSAGNSRGDGCFVAYPCILFVLISRKLLAIFRPLSVPDVKLC